MKLTKLQRRIKRRFTQIEKRGGIYCVDILLCEGWRFYCTYEIRAAAEAVRDKMAAHFALMTKRSARRKVRRRTVRLRRTKLVVDNESIWANRLEVE